MGEAELYSHLSEKEGGVQAAMRLRSEVQHTLKADKNESSKAMANLDGSLRAWLGAVFCADATSLRRVTFDTASGQTLEKVATEDAVLQKVRSIRELKRRLDNGRRCYGLFHDSLPSDPLAFVHVALTPELAPSLKYLTSHATERDGPTHAMFYSVNSPHGALSGLDMAVRVIKGATGQVLREFPSVKVLSTLSPVPGFMRWLSRGGSPQFAIPPVHRTVLMQQVAAGSGSGSSQVTDGELLVWIHAQVAAKGESAVASLDGPLTWLCAHYLAKEKSNNLLPLDPVARFHLRNGASLHRLNWMGNTSSQGLVSAAGFMCNYVYDLEQLPERALGFQSKSGSFHMGELVASVLQV